MDATDIGFVNCVGKTKTLESNMVTNLDDSWDELTAVLPAEQREQLAQLILARLAAGWGEIDIDFEDHHIKVFRETHSIRAHRPPKVDLTEQTCYK